MADELDPVEGVPVDESQPAEGDETQPQTEETNDTPPNPIEALASEMGWTPREAFRGDPEKWKPADEFIKAGRDINQTLHREVRSLRDQVGRTESMVSKVTEDIVSQRIAERDRYWQTIHAKAVEDGDTQTASRAVQEIVKIREERPPPAPHNDVPPETSAFMERHQNWFGKDPLATMRAKEVAEKLARDGHPVTEQLAQAERAVRREFPELFPAPAKQPAAVQTGQARNATASSRKKGFADMPAEAQSVARDFHKRHGIPLEKTAASYWQDQANQRRVG